MPDRKRVLIVGGVAGGASAAARLRRLSEDAEIVMFERGENISFANCGMPYHIGGTIPDRTRLLVQTPGAMRKRYRIDVRTRCEVTAIDRPNQRITVRDLATGKQYEESYDALVLSPGAEPVRPPIPGIDSPLVFTLRSLADMDAIKKLVDEKKPGHAVVIGGGYIGLEMAEALRQRNVGVSLVELASQVFIAADPEMVAPVHEELKRHGVDLRLGASVTAVRQEEGQLCVALCDGQVIHAGLAILAIGVRPETKLARDAGLELGPTGAILVDDHMRTSDPAVYAVGDAVEVAHLVSGAKAVIPLAGPANRQGRIAADNICGIDSVYHATQGTAICKVFDLAIGMTGLSEKALKKADLNYEKIYVHPASHAGYYPGAMQMSLKLLFDPVGGRILGAQAVGPDGIDKRIDVLAVAIRAGLTVHDLEDQELSYAPPYGSAKDPINYAGFVAGNAIRGRVRICHVQDVLNATDRQLVLDVRTPAEIQAGAIPGALNIPLDDLRERLAELPRDKEILVACQVGLRGYLACRILSQNGFVCRNLSGGYKTFKAVTGMLNKDEPVRKETTSDTGGSAPATAPGSASAGCHGPAPLQDHAASGAPDSSSGATPRRCMLGGALLHPSGATGDSSAGCHGPAPLQGHALPDAFPAGSVPQVVRQVDARGLQCPGPIMQLKAEIDRVDSGKAVSIIAGDPAFARDVAAWCHSTGNKLLDIRPEGLYLRATIQKNGVCHMNVGCHGTASLPGHASHAAPAIDPKTKTLVVFSGDLDRALAAFIIANGAAAMGSKVTLFFTFWGINILRRPEKVGVAKNLVERMFGWMMPRGAARLALSKMNMAGMGAAMIKGIMRKKSVPSLPDMIAAAQKAGVRLVVCTMSMDLMGIKREELIDGIEEGGVATYLDSAEAGNVNLFI